MGTLIIDIIERASMVFTSTFKLIFEIPLSFSMCIISLNCLSCHLYDAIIDPISMPRFLESGEAMCKKYW